MGSVADIELKMSQVRTFITVANTLNFRKAGEILRRSQPAVSLCIKETESILEQKLFTKSSPLKLTAFGQHFLPLAQGMLRNYEKSLKEITGLANGSRGLIAVAVLPSVGSEILPPLLAHVLREFPLLEVKVLDDNSDNVTKMVREGRVDFGIAALSKPDPLISFEAMLEDTFGLVCLESDPLAAKAEMEWAELVNLEMIGNGTFKLFDEAQRKAVKTRFYVNNSTSLFGMIRAGIGMTILPELAVDPSRGLRFIPLKKPNITRRIGILQLRSLTTLHPAAEHLKQMILAKVSQGSH